MAKVVQFRSTDQSILKIIRKVAADSARCFITPAGAESMSRDGVSMRQVMRCLESGKISNGPYQDEHGLTCTELELLTAGRTVRVVVSIEGHEPTQRVLHILFAEEI